MKNSNEICSAVCSILCDKHNVCWIQPVTVGPSASFVQSEDHCKDGSFLVLSPHMNQIAKHTWHRYYYMEVISSIWVAAGCCNTFKVGNTFGYSPLSLGHKFTTQTELITQGGAGNKPDTLPCLDLLKEKQPAFSSTFMKETANCTIKQST